MVLRYIQDSIIVIIGFSVKYVSLGKSECIVISVYSIVFVGLGELTFLQFNGMYDNSCVSLDSELELFWKQ